MQMEEKEILSNKIFGVRPVMEALSAGKSIEKIMLRSGTDNESFHGIRSLAESKKITVQWVPNERLDRLVKGNHQGVVAFLSAAEYSDLGVVLEDIHERGEVPLILLLDRVTDVRNFGAIARTAECAGVHALVIPAKGAAPLSADAMKTSAGALNYLPVCKVPNLKTAIFQLKSYDIQIVAASEKAESDYFSQDYTKPTAIIMGSEEIGISKSNLDLADSVVRIPLVGNIDSLNVSVAAAVFVFECVRQRNS